LDQGVRENSLFLFLSRFKGKAAKPALPLPPYHKKTPINKYAKELSAFAESLSEDDNSVV